MKDLFPVAVHLKKNVVPRRQTIEDWSCDSSVKPTQHSQQFFNVNELNSLSKIVGMRAIEHCDMTSEFVDTFQLVGIEATALDQGLFDGLAGVM